MWRYSKFMALPLYAISQFLDYPNLSSFSPNISPFFLQMRCSHSHLTSPPSQQALPHH